MGNVITLLDVLGAGGTVDRTTRRRLVGLLSDEDLEALEKRLDQVKIDAKLSKKYAWRPFGGENMAMNWGS